MATCTTKTIVQSVVLLPVDNDHTWMIVYDHLWSLSPCGSHPTLLLA